MFDSSNIELASAKIKPLKLENVSNTYSAFNEVKFDTEDSNDQFLLYNQFVAWKCDGCSIAPRSDYPHNDTYKELPRLKNFFTD